MRPARRQVRQKEVAVNIIHQKNTDSISPLKHEDLLSLQEAYQKEIKSLQEELNTYKEKNSEDAPKVISRALKNNLNKFTNAISLETKEQRTEWPKLTSTILRKKYKITADSFKSCLNYGLSRKIFERKQVSYSGNVPTFAYKLLTTEKKS